MASEIIVTPKGLQTNASQILAGGGGLSECTNAICRRPGMIEPRGGFVVTGDPAAPGEGTLSITELAVQFGTAGDTYIVASNGSTNSEVRYGPTNANALSLGQPNLTPRSAMLGESLALSLDGGIRMIDSAASTPDTGANRFCGVPRPQEFAAYWYTNAVTARHWLTTGYQTAYRVVWKRTINGRDYLSPPTDRRVVYNNSGSTKGANLYIPVAAVNEGWTIQVYRSPTMQAYGTPPSDEMRLRWTHVVTSADVATGYVQFIDGLADDTWSGATIYTAGTQDGLALSNYAPGTCADLATYAGMTFLGGHRTGQRLAFTVNSMGDQADPTQTFCSVKLGATTSSVSTTVTGLTAAALTYLAEGQIVTLSSNISPGSADATFLAACKIVSINTGAASMVVSSLPQTTGAVTIIAWDWINVAGTDASRRVYASWVDKVGATTFDANTYAAPGSVPYIYDTHGVWCTSDEGVASGFSGGVGDLARAFGTLSPVSSSSVEVRAWAITPATNSNLGGQITFAEILVNDAGGVSELNTNTFVVTSTKPQACSINLDATTGVSSLPDGGYNVLAWSKLDQPESFPLPYFVEIGSSSNVIDRVAATSDSLFVFTREGTYRVYGVTPDNLSIGPWDPTCRTLETGTGWVTRHGDALYAWVLRGIVRVTSSGVENIDESIRDIVRTYIPNTYNPSITGSYAGPDEQNGLVVFGFQSAQGNDPKTLVYSTLSGTWQTFNPTICGDRFTISCASRALDGSLLVGTSGRVGYASYFEVPYQDTLTGASYPYRGDVYYGTFFFTMPDVTVVVGTVLTIDVGDTIQDVAVGDMIGDSAGTIFYVTAVDGADITVHKTGAALGTLALIWKSYPVTITYVASTEGVPLAEKTYRDQTLNFGILRYGRTYTLSTNRYGESSASATSQTVVYDSDLTTYAPYTKSAVTRRSVPRGQGRGVALAMTFSQQQAMSYWQLMSASVGYELVTDKVNRGQS